MKPIGEKRANKEKEGRKEEKKMMEKKSFHMCVLHVMKEKNIILM